MWTVPPAEQCNTAGSKLYVTEPMCLVVHKIVDFFLLLLFQCDKFPHCIPSHSTCPAEIKEILMRERERERKVITEVQECCIVLSARFVERK
jgi:hypothetical protein